MNISYREAKRILAKQEEAREVINSYRGMETLGKRPKSAQTNWGTSSVVAISSPACD